MKYSDNQRQASYYIEQGKGFTCPVCESFVSPGFDYCPNCGAMPQYDNSDDNYELGLIFINLVLVILAPVVYLMTTLQVQLIDIVVAIPLLILMLLDVRLIIERLKEVLSKKITLFKKIRRLITPIWVSYFLIKAVLLVLE